MVLLKARAVDEPALICAAHACASDKRFAEVLNRSTMPSAKASLTSTFLPEKINSLALARPTRLGRKYMPPPSGTMARWI